MAAGAVWPSFIEGEKLQRERSKRTRIEPLKPMVSYPSLQSGLSPSMAGSFHPQDQERGLISVHRGGPSLLAQTDLQPKFSALSPQSYSIFSLYNRMLKA
ncbi:hypothetical protein SRHO_G00283980 [Serrasalmus rhombeus]